MLLVLFDLFGQEVKFTPGQCCFVTLVNPPYDEERGARRHFPVVTFRTSAGPRLLHATTQRRLQALVRRTSIGAEAEVAQRGVCQ
jgi:hypothetical protein